MPKDKDSAKKTRRNFPYHILEDSLPVAQKIADEMAGKPFKRLLLADALGLKPNSEDFRNLLSSAYNYGLTDGTRFQNEIGLTETGLSATQNRDLSKRREALRNAALTPPVFKKFYEHYSDRKLPSNDMMSKILVAEYGVPKELGADCARFLIENARLTGIVREIGGSPHVLLDSDMEPVLTQEAEEAPDEIEERDSESIDAESEDKRQEAQEEIKEPPPVTQSHPQISTEPPRAIFIGHGKNKAPLQKLQAILSSFQILHKVTIDEANLGRPIPQKVKETMQACGSAILIFTCDEKFYDEHGNIIWRPSENVVHELGAASFLYGDRIVIFKEKGLHFPTNFR